MIKSKVKRAMGKDGGPFYGRKVPRSELRYAKPEHVIGSGFVWWMSGSDNWGVQVDKGILPAAIISHLGEATAQTPLGRGGHWYATEADAMNALKHALDKTADQSAY